MFFHQKFAAKSIFLRPKFQKFRFRFVHKTFDTKQEADRYMQTSGIQALYDLKMIPERGGSHRFTDLIHQKFLGANKITNGTFQLIQYLRSLKHPRLIESDHGEMDIVKSDGEIDIVKSDGEIDITVDMLTQDIGYLKRRGLIDYSLLLFLSVDKHPTQDDKYCVLARIGICDITKYRFKSDVKTAINNILYDQTMSNWVTAQEYHDRFKANMVPIFQTSLTESLISVVSARENNDGTKSVVGTQTNDSSWS